MAWETGFIRRLYDFGQITPLIGTDKNGKLVIKAYAENADDMVRLVRSLFYRVPFSESVTDFGPTTKLLNHLAASDLMFAIATILFHCSEVRKHIPGLLEFCTHLKLLFPQRSLRDQIVMLINIQARDKALEELNEEGKIEFRKILANQTVKKVSREVANDLYKCEKLIKKILSPLAYISLCDAKDTGNKHFECGKPKIQERLLGSLLESDPKNKEAIFQSYTMEMIFLAFVYKNFGHERENINKFYIKMNELFNGKYLKNKNTFSMNDLYEAVKPEDALERLNHLCKQENIDEYAEDIVFYSTQLSKYPSMNNYKKVEKYLIGGVKNDVTDCMENAIRNFMRFLLYDADMKKISIESKNYVITSKAKVFFEKYSLPQIDDSEAAHREWLDVVSNIPYVLYCRTIEKGTTVDVAGNGLYAFLMVSEEEEIDEEWLKTHKIKMIHKNGYEIMPCIHNIIVILNHLLGCGLFENKKMHEEIVRNDFIKEYFPLLCDKLDCKGFSSTKQESIQQEGAVNFDGYDFVSQIYTTCTFMDYTCQFMTKPAHGELYAISKHQGYQIKLPDITVTQCPTLSLVITYLKDTYEDSSLSWLRSQDIYTNLFALPLDDNNKTAVLMSGISRKFTPREWLRWPAAKSIVMLMLRILDRQPDEAVKIELKLRWYNFLITENFQFDNIVPAIKAASMGANFYKAPQAQVMALDIFTKLLERGYDQVYGPAIEAVDRCFDNLRGMARNMVNKLYQALFAQNNAHQRAMIAAEATVEKAMKSDTPEVVLSGMRLLSIIFKESGKLSQQMMDILCQTVIMGDKPRSQSAVDLFRTIIHQADLEKMNSLTRDYIIKIIQAALVAGDYKLQDAIELCEALIEKSYVAKFMIDVARYMLSENYSCDKKLGINLFKKLLLHRKELEEKGLFEAAVNAAIQSASADVKLMGETSSMNDLFSIKRSSSASYGLDLFKFLFEDANTRERALEAACKIVNEVQDNESQQKLQKLIDVYQYK